MNISSICLKRNAVYFPFSPLQSSNSADPTHLWSLYVEAIIESEAQPAIVQLKSEA